MGIVTGPEYNGSLTTPAPTLQVGARVQILGERGIYLVAHIDKRRHLVDLLPLDNSKPELGIRITAIRVLPDSPPSYLSTKTTR